MKSIICLLATITFSINSHAIFPSKKGLKICYEKTYTDAEINENPSQKIKQILISAVDEEFPDSDSGETLKLLHVEVKYKNDPNTYSQTPFCDEETFPDLPKNNFMCVVECDGGRIKIEPLKGEEQAADGTYKKIKATNSYLRLNGGCGYSGDTTVDPHQLDESQSNLKNTFILEKKDCSSSYPTQLHTPPSTK